MIPLLLALMVLGQIPPIVVTDADIEICFPDAHDANFSNWYSPGAVTVSYSAEPVGTHSATGKLGPQKWEGLLQEDDPAEGKAEMVFDLASLPSRTSDPNGPPARIYSFRFRVRYENAIVTSVWSDASQVRVIGKPGIPAYTQ